MENSLVNQIKQFISPDFISNLGIGTNETESNIGKAFDAAIPALLLKMNNKSDAFLGGMFSQIQNIFKDSNGDFDFKLNKFGGILNDFLGNDKDQFVSGISKYAGISETSTSSVLNTAFLGILDYFKSLNFNLDFSSIKNLLSTNLGSLQGLLPAGLGSFGLLSTSVNEPAITHHETREHADAKINEIVNHNEKDQFKTNNSPYTNPSNNNGGGGWLKYLLIPLLLGIVLIFFLYRGCDKKAEVKEPVTTDTINQNTDTQTTTTTTTKRVTKEVVLNDQVKLNAYTDGIEDKLVAFLNKGDYKNMTEDQLKEIWFDFDNLNFEINTANVLPESQAQLENIAKILTAFPNVKIKIGGYTDKTGNEDHNKKLSNERALAVKKFLEAKGLGKQVVGAEGYGSEFAKHPADASEELRVTDRKVAISVRN